MDLCHLFQQLFGGGGTFGPGARETQIRWSVLGHGQGARFHWVVDFTIQPLEFEPMHLDRFWPFLKVILNCKEVNNIHEHYTEHQLGMMNNLNSSGWMILTKVFESSNLKNLFHQPLFFHLLQVFVLKA